METISFYATVEKVQDMADNAIRVYLDLPESAIDAMAKLKLCKNNGAVLEIVATPRLSMEENKEWHS